MTANDLNAPFVRVSTIGPDTNDTWHVHAIVWQPGLGHAVSGTRVKLGTITKIGRRRFRPTRIGGETFEGDYSALGHATRWLARPVMVFDPPESFNIDGHRVEGVIRAFDDNSLNVKGGGDDG